MSKVVQMETKNQDRNSNNASTSVEPTLKVICLDLDETLIHATRVACNNTGGKQLKYWGQRVSACRELETKKLLKDKPVDCKLSDEEYLRKKYGPPLFEKIPDIASPYQWSFPTDDFSSCWLLMRCYNENNKITSFYRIEYRPYCQHLIETINKYKKHCNVKVAISTMATRQYGILACEGLKLFKGYLENINGVSTPFIDKFVGLEDWREKCWSHQHPGSYGKKSLKYISSLFGISSSHIIAIDDKPQIWTNTQQVIYAVPYQGGIHANHNENNVQFEYNGSNKELKLDDMLYKISKYFENCLHQAINPLQKQNNSPVHSHKNKNNNHNNDKNDNNKNKTEQSLKKLSLDSSTSVLVSTNNINNDDKTNDDHKGNHNDDENHIACNEESIDDNIDVSISNNNYDNLIKNENEECNETNLTENIKQQIQQKTLNAVSHNCVQVLVRTTININK